MEQHKAAINGALSGVGGIVAMVTLEQVNVLLGTVAGILTVAHLSIQLVKTLRKK